MFSFSFSVAKLMKDTLPKVSDDFYEEINSVKDRRDELQSKLLKFNFQFIIHLHIF